MLEEIIMKKRIWNIIYCMLITTMIFSVTGQAGDEENPEITDAEGDAFGYLDINSVWFYEEEVNPGYLFVSMKINEPSNNKFQQTFAVFWKYENKQYACSLHLGFGFGDFWEKYGAGKYIYRESGGGSDYVHNISDCTYSVDNGIIAWKISKDIIGNPQKDDLLFDTWSNAFRRLGFLGRIGFSRPILDSIIFRLLGNSLWDFAPDNYDEYGLDYIIQY